MEMTNKIYAAISILAFSLLMTSCGKDDPPAEGGGGEEEVITTLEYTLVDLGGNTVTLLFTDLDGDGGNEPVIEGGTLKANTTYTGSLRLSNDSEDPAEDITAEIREEDEDHQFFFSSSVAGVSVEYTDQDENNNPIGLTNALNTGAAGSGTLTVILRHEPNKSGAGVSDGDITNAGGETDIEVPFPIDVQ